MVRKRVPVLTRKGVYQGVTEITGKNPGKSSWTDDEILAFQSIRLTVLTDEEMDREVKYFLHGMQVKMTNRAVASALILTWNMRSSDPVEERIFPTADAGMDPRDVSIADLEVEGEVYESEGGSDLVNVLSGFERRRAGAFVAASTLKLFSKSTSGWNRAWEKDHIGTRYTGFVKKEFPLSALVPCPNQVEVLGEAFQGIRLFKGTLGRILYALADLEDTKMTTMLFEQHLSFTGMHIIPQFIDAKMDLGATTEDLLDALDVGKNRATLLQLRALIDTSMSLPMGPDNRGTWRYSRLFDSNAYPLLRTEYAKETVAVLAAINALMPEPDSRSNPLNMAVLKKMDPVRMAYLKKVARNIYGSFSVTANAARRP